MPVDVEELLGTLVADLTVLLDGSAVLGVVLAPVPMAMTECLGPKGTSPLAPLGDLRPVA